MSEALIGSIWTKSWEFTIGVFANYKLILNITASNKSDGITINTASDIMTKVKFLDNSTIEVVARDGEKFVLKSHLPVHHSKQKFLAQSLAKYFTECFSNDKSSMIYWVLMKTLANDGFGFSYESSDRSEERERIGAKIRDLRESKGMEAKQLAMLANIDAANLSRIENGKYSVGFDILVKIANALGAKVDLV